MDEAKADNTQERNGRPLEGPRLAVARQAGPTLPLDPARGLTRLSPWPYEPNDTSPLAWWRRLPPDSFHDAERSLLRATLGDVRVLRGGNDLAAALQGDAVAAVGAALGLMPITEVTLPVDVTMSCLLYTALKQDATAALVMSQIAGLTDLGHGFAIELAGSWFKYGRRHSDDPRKFDLAEDVLLIAFRQRQNGDHGA
ncbi:hypothetical protein [Bradyrhizobium guangzhouense]|uniref:hypothetical protein n=1 Tax=Bradyrhizobium guangzhouense TaxID=1325095 RepID=UPI0010099D7D|nr:hypothetical protein [Bradyrhizobium guangzhouense]